MKFQEHKLLLELNNQTHGDLYANSKNPETGADGPKVVIQNRDFRIEMGLNDSKRVEQVAAQVKELKEKINYNAHNQYNLEDYNAI